MTSYQYDSANQLLTAEKGESLWHYVYDSNGNLVEVLPNNTETNGAKRYIYNTAGYLTQVETHNGSGWDVQAEMAYNGLGQRLSMDAAGVIAYYVMDGNRPLTAESNGNTTSYLYGLGVIGEETNEWSYALTDGTNTQRQLTDALGEVTYSARYTPWGDTLETYGTGNFAFGHFGGLMDAATGLLYVGDGQYYDPSTGRFLTRNARPNSPNPYLPFDPTGVLFLPLALVSLLYGRKRRKSKWDILVIVTLLSLSAGMGVAACNSNPPPGNITATGTATPVPGGSIVTGTVDINGTTITGTAYVPTSSPYAPIIATPCPTPTATPTPTTIDEEMAQYGVYFTGATTNALREWSNDRKGAVKKAVQDVARKFSERIGGSPQEAFKRVYGYINFEWTYEAINGFGWAYNDHTIKWGGFYRSEYQAVRNVVHELGHIFDRMVCASRRANGVCDNVFHNSARTDLSAVWGNEYCGRDLSGGMYLCLGRRSHSGPEPGMYWGFAGDWEEWQFGATHGDGEVWADMFLAWVYDRWGNDRFGDRRSEYMNSQMSTYLNIFR